MLAWRESLLIMADENKFNDDDKNPKKGGEFRVPPRTWVVWVAIIGSIVTLVFFNRRMESQPNTLLPYEFQQKIDSNLLATVSLNYDPQSPGIVDIIGSYYKTDDSGKVLKNEKPIPFHTEESGRKNC